MPSTAKRVVVFAGTTTASDQDSTAVVFTWDLASSPRGSTPSATSSKEGIVNTSSSTYAQNSTHLPSSPSSSNAVASQTSFSPQVPAADKTPKQSPELYISLIVLSTVAIVSALVLGWLAWRRRRQHHTPSLDRNMESSHRDSTKRSSTLGKPLGSQSDTSDMTGSTLVSEGDWSVSTPPDSIDLHDRLGSNEKSSAVALLSSGCSRFSRRREQLEQPPRPPSKQNGRLPPTVPPSSPTFPEAVGTSRRSSRYEGAVTHVRMPPLPPLELRPISPLSGGFDYKV